MSPLSRLHASTAGSALREGRRPEGGHGATRRDEQLVETVAVQVGGRQAVQFGPNRIEQNAPVGDVEQHEMTRVGGDGQLGAVIEGAPDAASSALRQLAKDAGLDLAAALDTFDTRASFIAARGLDLDHMLFSASFARHLDYYSGFVFEARHAGAGDVPVIGGGRYDRLLRTLGATADIPAVGAAIWIDRLQGASRAIDAVSGGAA